MSDVELDPNAGGEDLAQPSETEVEGAADTPAVEETDEQRNERAANETRERAEKKAKGVQARLNELTADKHAERRRAEAAEQRYLALQQERANQPRQPQNTGEPQRTDPRFKSYEDYLEARADWRADMRSQQVWAAQAQRSNAERQQHANMQQANEMARAFESRLATDKKSVPDFDAVVADSDLEVANHVGAQVAASEIPAKVMHYLATHEDVVNRLNRSTPFAVARELGAIEATLRGSRQVSKAPAPGTPVGSKGVGDSDPPTDTEAYMRWAEKHLK